MKEKCSETQFICRKCGDCCKGTGIVVIYPDDVTRISAFLAITPSAFLDTYCTEHFLPVEEGATLQVFVMELHGKCRFLTDEQRCAIHAVKPLQCASGPMNYFQSLNSWRNCSQFRSLESSPFENIGRDDEFFVSLLLAGYHF